MFLQAIARLKEVNPEKAKEVLYKAEKESKEQALSSKIADQVAAPTRTIEKGKNYQFKVIVLGDIEVGKSSFIELLETEIFDQKSAPSSGISIAVKNIKADGINIRLSIMEPQARERFEKFHSSIALEARGAIIVFDLTRPETLSKVQKYVELVARVSKEVTFLVVGTKADLADSRAITTEEIERILDKVRAFCTKPKDLVGQKLLFQEYLEIDPTSKELAKESLEKLVKNMINIAKGIK